jgi:hypothetical protein
MKNALTISGSETLADLREKSDSGDTYHVDAKAVARFITRYIADDLSAKELEDIGDTLESAEFFEYVGPGSAGVIAQVVFEFSTPQTSGPITKDAATRWLGLLGD